MREGEPDLLQVAYSEQMPEVRYRQERLLHGQHRLARDGAEKAQQGRGGG
jgi:hypothetical protein